MRLKGNDKWIFINNAFYAAFDMYIFQVGVCVKVLGVLTEYEYSVNSFMDVVELFAFIKGMYFYECLWKMCIY